VANTLKLLRNGAVGFIDWLDASRCLTEDERQKKVNDDADVPNEHTPAQARKQSPGSRIVTSPLRSAKQPGECAALESKAAVQPTSFRGAEEETDRTTISLPRFAVKLVFVTYQPVEEVKRAEQDSDERDKEEHEHALRLTRIRLQLGVYFRIHRGEHLVKGCTMPSPVSTSPRPETFFESAI